MEALEIDSWSSYIVKFKAAILWEKSNGALHRNRYTRMEVVAPSYYSKKTFHKLLEKKMKQIFFFFFSYFIKTLKFVIHRYGSLTVINEKSNLNQFINNLFPLINLCLKNSKEIRSSFFHFFFIFFFVLVDEILFILWLFLLSFFYFKLLTYN